MNNKITALVAFLSIAALTALDQLFKHLVILHLKPVSSVTVIPGFLGLNYTENTGAMMGMFRDSRTVLIIVSSVLVAALLYVLFSGRIKNRFYLFCLILIASGGIGNMIDRIFRGFVVDFIEFLFVSFYVFNFADCLITVACFLLIGYEIYLLFIKDRKGKKDA